MTKNSEDIRLSYKSWFSHCLDPDSGQQCRSPNSTHLVMPALESKGPWEDDRQGKCNSIVVSENQPTEWSTPANTCIFSAAYNKSSNENESTLRQHWCYGSERYRSRASFKKAPGIVLLQACVYSVEDLQYCQNIGQMPDFLTDCKIEVCSKVWLCPSFILGKSNFKSSVFVNFTNKKALS